MVPLTIRKTCFLLFPFYGVRKSQKTDEKYSWLNHAIPSFRFMVVLPKWVSATLILLGLLAFLGYLSGLGAPHAASPAASDA